MKTKFLKIAPFLLMALIALVTMSMGADTHVAGGMSMAALPLLFVSKSGFVVKTIDEQSKMTFEELVDYRQKEAAYNAELVEFKFQAKIDELKKEKEVDAEKVAELEGVIKTIKQEHIEHSLRLAKMKTDSIKEDISLKSHVNKFVEENHKEILAAFKRGNGNVNLEFAYKVVDEMTTASATNPDGIPELVGVQIAPPGNVNLAGTIVDSLVTTFSTSQAAYAYTETVPKDGSYEFLAEQETKPMIDFKIETRYATPKKLAAYIKLTDEAVKDIPGLQSIAYDYLKKKHDLKRQNGLLFGDGIGDNPKGATEYGRAFVAGAMAGAFAAPNIMHAINAAVTDIATTHNYEDEMEYMANIAMMNPVDFFIQFVGAVTTDGLPLFPTAAIFNRVTIGGITIMPFRDIPTGKLFVADLKKFNVTRYVPYSVTIGWVNDDFIKNQFVVLGESRFHAFVKKLDEQAFIYDDIATILAAITTT